MPNDCSARYDNQYCPADCECKRVGQLRSGCDTAGPYPSNLHAWWIDKAEQEVDGVQAKLNEYGGASGTGDLRLIGLTLATRDVSDGEAVEIGIAFYCLGKVSRWITALKNGRRASDDTLHDLSVYTKMAQRIRETGDLP